MKVYAQSSCFIGHLRQTWNKSTNQEPEEISPQLKKVSLGYKRAAKVWRNMKRVNCVQRGKIGFGTAGKFSDPPKIIRRI